jgi:hypothetical protein
MQKWGWIYFLAMLNRRPGLLYVLTQLLALCLVAVSAADATPDPIVEFDYVNKFKGYVTTVSIDSDSTIRIGTKRTQSNAVQSSAASHLSSKQMDWLRIQINEVQAMSLEPAYGLGSLATDEPHYRFRFRRGDAWSETSIDPYVTTPNPPEQLLALQHFFMRLISRHDRHGDGPK